MHLETSFLNGFSRIHGSSSKPVRLQLDALRGSSQALEGLVRGLQGAMEEIRNAPAKEAAVPVERSAGAPSQDPALAKAAEAQAAELAAVRERLQVRRLAHY